MKTFGYLGLYSINFHMEMFETQFSAFFKQIFVHGRFFCTNHDSTICIGGRAHTRISPHRQSLCSKIQGFEKR